MMGSFEVRRRASDRSESTALQDAPSIATSGQIQCSRETFEAFVRWTLREEREALAGILDDADARAFFDYYAGLPSPDDELGVKRYATGLWNGEAGWVARWIRARRSTSSSSVRVLDAGSGYGSFSLLFARMGADVTGVDLRKDRLRVAERRRDLYIARTGRELSVHFEQRDLTRDTKNHYDAAWLYNAISHIDPPDRFLEVLKGCLQPGGIVAIADNNGANAAHQRRLAEKRSEVHVSYVDPGGESHAYADERMFSPAELRGLLEQAGFQVQRHELLYGGLGLVPAAIAAPLHAVQARIGPGARWARRQFVVAHRSAS